MLEIKLRAFAKINLGLDVTRKREDGYHEVRMVMQTIHLYDRILIQKTKDAQITVRTNLYYLPVNENNLVYQAAGLLKEEFGITDGIFIDLKKYIPVAAGMAGGSADAAAVLYGMNRLFGLGLTKKELMARGVKLGADVPYCIMRGTALSEGIGEILTPIMAPPKTTILIAKPPISVSTKFVYENLKLDENICHPNIDGIITAIKNRDLPQMAANMGNVLESVTVPHYPVIRQIKETMMENGALQAMMSGSGPTVFGLFTNTGQAKEAYDEIKRTDLAKQIYLTEMYNSRRKS